MILNYEETVYQHVRISQSGKDRIVGDIRIEIKEMVKLNVIYIVVGVEKLVHEIEMVNLEHVKVLNKGKIFLGILSI